MEVAMTLIKLAVVILAALMLLAETSFDYFAVQRDVFAGFAGNVDALERAMAVCEKALADNPKHPHALVWHGIGLIVRAGRSPQQAPALIQQAITEMDEAVKLDDPGDLGVRIPRGSVTMAMARSMPDSPMRTELFERGRTDFQYAFDMQSKAGQLEAIGTHPLGELLQGLGDVYSRLGKPDEARTYYQMLRAKLPDTEYARRAAQWMTTSQPLPAAQVACIGCHTAPKQ
jgi:tetratricopeptide (TPR) repeat protein